MSFEPPLRTWRTRWALPATMTTMTLRTGGALTVFGAAFPRRRPAEGGEMWSVGLAGS